MEVDDVDIVLISSGLPVSGSNVSVENRAAWDSAIFQKSKGLDRDAILDSGTNTVTPDLHSQKAGVVLRSLDYVGESIVLHDIDEAL